MNSLDFGMKHTCQVVRTTQDQRLDFTSGTVAFTVGSLLEGETSGASGTIKSIVLSSGSWTGGNASGYLILYNISGTFGNETIQDEGTETPGSATASGPVIPQTNGVGTPVMTSSRVTYSCKFTKISSNGGIQNYGSGDYITAYDIVFLPADAVVQEGDHITSSDPGHAYTYRVTQVNPLYNFFRNTIDHIEASLKVVEKRG